MTDANPKFDLATARDTDELVAMMRALYAEDEGFAFDEAVARKAIALILGDERNGRVWLIRTGGETAGYVVLATSFSLEYHGRDAFIDEVYVLPAWRGRGLGTRALERALEECRAMGAAAVHLEVGHDNPRARALYERLGFEDRRRYLLTRWLVDR